MTTIAVTSQIVGSFFSNLTLHYGWTPTMVSEALSEINGSPYLVDQLINLQTKLWQIEPVTAGSPGNASGAGGDPYLKGNPPFFNGANW